MTAARSTAPADPRRRRGRGWSTPKKPRPPLPRSPSPARELTLLPPGIEVEVRVDDEEFYGSWLEATVVGFAPSRGRRSPARYTVKHSHLLADDGGALTERFAPTHIRPRPPPPETPPRFRLHGIVEAFHNGGWWSGIVVAAAPASAVTVAFPITREVIPFPPHLVRPRRDYVDGKWAPSQALIAVQPNRAVRAYEVGDSVEVVREREAYGFSWFPAAVAKVIDTLSYLVEYLDQEEANGGADKETEYLHWRFIRPSVEHSSRQCEVQLGPGAAVEAYCDGAWSRGVVRRVVGDGEFEVSIDGKEAKQLVTKVVELLRPQYEWDGKNWRIVSTKVRLLRRSCSEQRKVKLMWHSASGKRPSSPVEVPFSDDGHSHDPEYPGTKKSRKEHQVAISADGSEHTSVSKMGSPLSELHNSPALYHPLNSCSLLYGYSTALKNDASDNVQNQLEGNRKLPCQVDYTSKKMAGKEKEGFEGSHSLHSSLESPSTGKKRGVNKILESTKSSWQQFDITLDDTLHVNEVTYQEPLAMVPSGFESASDDIDIHCSQLDEGLTAPSSGCQANRNTDVLPYSTGTRVPFVKSSHVWSLIEERVVFKEFPQRPHFLPLQQYLPGLREGMALGLMVSFDLLVENIRKSSIADSEASFEEKKWILAELKANGFDIQPLQVWLNKLIKVKSEYSKHLEEKSAVEAQKMGTISSFSRIDSLLCDIDNAMVELEQKLGHLRRKGQLIEKEREHDEEELSRLNVVESSVKKALDVDKRQFRGILAGMQQNRLT